MLVLDVQKSDSVIHIYVSILLQILFLFSLLQSIEQCSLCYRVGPGCDCYHSFLNDFSAFVLIPNLGEFRTKHMTWDKYIVLKG